MEPVEIILDVAFILVCVSFFKQQMGLKGAAALACAFVTALIVGLSPVLSSQFPALAPWISAVINVIVLFLSAAGSFDTAAEFAKRFNQARAPGR